MIYQILPSRLLDWSWRCAELFWWFRRHTKNRDKCGRTIGKRLQVSFPLTRLCDANVCETDSVLLCDHTIRVQKNICVFCLGIKYNRLHSREHVRDLWSRGVLICVGRGDSDVHLRCTKFASGFKDRVSRLNIENHVRVTWMGPRFNVLVAVVWPQLLCWPAPWLIGVITCVVSTKGDYLVSQDGERAIFVWENYTRERDATFES